MDDEMIIVVGIFIENGFGGFVVDLVCFVCNDFGVIKLILFF